MNSKKANNFILRLLAVVVIGLAAGHALRAQTPITLQSTYNGRYNIIATGGSLRNASNATNPCSLGTTSSGTLAGLPASATVRQALLYWAGSGPTPDYTVTFDGASRTATRTYTSLYSASATNNLSFFGGVADVTAAVQAGRNKAYGFSNLTVTNTNLTGANYCGSAAVLSAWALYVVYEDVSESPKRINMYEGFANYRSSSGTMVLDGLNVPASPQGKMSVLAWEGDSDITTGEILTFNTTAALTDGLNPSGNVFNSTISNLGTGSNTAYGLDLDTYDISSRLTPGMTTANATVATGTDLILLNAVVLTGSTSTADLSLTKTVNTPTANIGDTLSYTLTLRNNGPGSTQSTRVTDLLPAGLTFASASTASGTYNSATGVWRTGAIASGGSAILTINATVNAAAAGTSITNTSEVTYGDTFDPDSTPANGANAEDDYSAVTTAIRPNADLKVAKTGPASATLGQPISYSMVVTNSGPNNVTGLTFTDNVPASVTVTNWTCVPTGTASCSAASGTNANISLTGNINSGAANFLTITVNGVVNATGSIVNTATVANPATLFDPAPGDNTSSATTVAGVSVAGTVWADVDGSAAGTFTNINTGTEVGTNAGGLFAIVVSSTGTVLGSAAVAADGTYTVFNLPANTTGVTVRIATSAGTVGQPAPAAAVPAAWFATSPVTTASFNLATANVAARDFGVEQRPTAAGGTVSALSNPGGTNTVAVPPSIFGGTDPDGSIASFKITAFPTNATSVTIGGVTYTSANFPAGGVTVAAVAGAFPTGGILIDPIDGAVTVSFTYSVTDNAGGASTATSTATLPFSLSLPPNVGLVKSCTAPANCQSSGQLPGTDLTYRIDFTNTGGQSAQGLSILDAIPLNTDFKVDSAGVAPPAGITFVIEYSYDYNAATPAAATWTAVQPASAGGGASAGYNSLVRAVRWRMTAGSLSSVSGSNSGNVLFTVKIR